VFNLAALLLAETSPALLSPAALQQLLLSVSLALGSALLAVSLGLPLALILSRLTIAGQRAALIALLALLLVPLYVHLAGWDAVGAWLGIFGRNAPQAALSGLPSAIWVHGIAAVPWAAVIISVGLTQVPRHEEEQALVDSSLFNLFWRIVLPRLGPWIATGAFFAALTSWYEMTVTNVYLVPTVTEGVYNRVAGNATHSSIYAFPAYVLFALLLAMAAYATRVLMLGDFREWNRPAPRWSLTTSVGGTSVVWLLLLLIAGVPLLVLVRQAGLTTRILDNEPIRQWTAAALASTLWRTLLVTRMDFFWTLVTGSLAATIAVVIAVPAAWWGRGRQSEPTSRWKFGVLVLVALLLLAVPGPLVALAIMQAMNWPGATPLHFLYDRTVVAPAIAQAVRAFPLVLLLIWHAIGRFDRTQLEAAELDGCGPWQSLWRVVLPQRRGALAAAWLVALTIAVGDVSASLLVIPAGKDLIQRRLFGMIHSGVDNQVAAACLILIAFLTLCAAASSRFRVRSS
jgi:iron(III) transport system permease protein